MPHKTFTGFTWNPKGVEAGCLKRLTSHMQPQVVEVSLAALEEQVRLGHEAFVVQAGVNDQALFTVRVVA